jgi:DNA-binding transcriptional regulator YhcF (GntR family)
MDQVYRNEKIREFLLKLTPSKTRNNKERDLSDSAIAFGNLIDNNQKLKSEIGESFFGNHQMYTIENIKNKNLKLVSDEVDQYYTPNYFLGKESSRKTAHSVSWLNALYVDIDGIKGVKDSHEALLVLYKACEKAELKLPDVVIKTSINPTVHLQALWLIDPFSVKTMYNFKRNQKYKKWWKTVNTGIAYSLEQADERFNIDYKVSRDFSTYLRLPYTYHQKTGELVEILDERITEKRHIFMDDWIQETTSRYIEACKNNDFFLKPKKDNKDDDIKLIDHPQFAAILEGVPEGYRYKSHYGLIKAFKSSEYTKKETLKEMLKFNKRCDPPENERKIEKTVEKTFNDGKGINIKIVAEVANNSFADAEAEFEPDPKILRLFNIAKGTLEYQKKNNNYEEIFNKLFHFIRAYKKAGHDHIPSQKELADILKLKYNTIRQYFNLIKKELRKKSIYLNYNYKKKKYCFISMKKWIQNFVNKIKNLKSNSNFKSNNHTQKVIHNLISILVIYSMKGQKNDFRQKERQEDYKGVKLIFYD